MFPGLLDYWYNMLGFRSILRVGVLSLFRTQEHILKQNVSWNLTGMSRVIIVEMQRLTRISILSLKILSFNMFKCIGVFRLVAAFNLTHIKQRSS